MSLVNWLLLPGREDRAHLLAAFCAKLEGAGGQRHDSTDKLNFVHALHLPATFCNFLTTF
jgi:hypothetical protein